MDKRRMNMENEKMIICDVGELRDITNAGNVELQISNDGKTIWINIDGMCKLRVCKIKRLAVRDDRRKK